MIDYQLKSTVINTPLFNEYRKIRRSKQFYIYYFNIPYKDTLVKYYNLEDYYFNSSEFDCYLQEVKKNNLYPLKKLLELENFYLLNNPIEWTECKRIYNSHCSRVTRLKKRIEKIVLSKKAIFLSITFNPKTFNITNSKTRKKYVSRFLNELHCDYVANIDFGKKNKREHYHAIVQLDKVDHKLWQYGAINFQRIHSTDDATKLARYVAKLVNHAIKETTKRCAIMYCKKYK